MALSKEFYEKESLLIEIYGKVGLVPSDNELLLEMREEALGKCKPREYTGPQHKHMVNVKALKEMMRKKNMTEISLEMGRSRTWLYGVMYSGRTTYDSAVMIAEYLNVPLKDISL